MDTKNLQWGLRPFPENAVIIFGARAIMDSTGELEFLQDRQNFAYKPEAESQKTEFINWINSKALSMLKSHIIENCWNGRTTEIFEYSEGLYYCKSTPNGSHGYCYITCWEARSRRQ